MDNNNGLKEIAHKIDCKKMKCANMAREGD